MHERSCSCCSRRGRMRRAKRLRRARDRCLLAVARVVALLVAVVATQLRTIKHDMISGLTIVTPPFLPKGWALHSEVTNLRASRAGPVRRRGRACRARRCSMPQAETVGVGGRAVRKRERDRVAFGQLEEQRLREAARELVSFELKDEFGGERRLSHHMQVCVGASSK